jgi:DNA-binding phage protein
MHEATSALFSRSMSGEGNPSFDTILKVTHALGLQFRAAALNT